MTSSQPLGRLLAGPALDGVSESFVAHTERLGAMPRGAEVRYLIPTLEASGLLGRGGAGFPVGRKWRALADRRSGRAVVVVNGAEGEPASHKDRTLMIHRPHLVVDGALLAAAALGADEIVFYVGAEHGAAVAAIGRAIDERRRELPQCRLVRAPTGYVAGEASAVAHYLNDADARPTTTPPRVSERGVAGGATLVQNVESLAYAALIARFGERWYRSAGRVDSPGTALITVTGAVDDEGVREIELGTTIGDATRRVATGTGGSGDLADIERWSGQIPGRGACHHPDGAVQLMTSALNVFGDEFVHHARTGRCSVTGSRIVAA